MTAADQGRVAPRPLQRLGRGERFVLGLAILAAFALSLGKYQLEAYPRKAWRNEPPKPSVEVCPDGMDLQIELFGALFRGESDARARLAHFLPTYYESSTYLAGVAGGALNAAGVPAPRAFMIVSAVASLLLLRLLAWLLGEVAPDAPRLRLLALLAFLAHPATIRCLTRPQTDALYALAVVAALAWGRRIASGTFERRHHAALAATQALATFAKIHVLPLLFVPAVAAFAQGVRGRRLGAAIVWGALVPLAIWAAVFAAFGLFGSIEKIAAWVGEQFQDWTPQRAALLVLATQGPLLLLAALHPRLWRGFPLALLLFVAGYALLLIVAKKPPLMRFAYPVEAPLVLLAASAARERFGVARAASAAMAGVLAAHLLLVAGYAAVRLYLTYVGPVARIQRWASFAIWLA